MAATTNNQNRNPFGMIGAAIAAIALSSAASGFEGRELRPVTANVDTARVIVGQPAPEQRPERVDERVNWNKDKFVNIQDLLAYLDDYFARNDDADIIGNGDGVTGFDLITYLDWFLDPAAAAG